eukprot:TRINITY_DN49196_c0_g1_i1.p1 TRINITY_DN49196_c0_g1~~TRINITY_DN49196_c0_g1_i1.p1  ORF type:complete len:105 (-),score=21.02 TRINITY_DN49196_c0_g1_i1:10-285(-)
MEQPASPAEVTVVAHQAKEKQVVLKLRKQNRNVKWHQNVKDPNPNQKTSKICCVFHRRRSFGESDTESDTPDDSASDKEDGAPCRCKTTFN